jgi:hypothetical protein
MNLFDELTKDFVGYNQHEFMNIKCHDGEFYIHKCIARTCESDFIKKILNNQFCREHIINLEDHDVNDVKNVIMKLYLRLDSKYDVTEDGIIIAEYIIFDKLLCTDIVNEMNKFIKTNDFSKVKSSVMKINMNTSFVLNNRYLLSYMCNVHTFDSVCRRMNIFNNNNKIDTDDELASEINTYIITYGFDKKKYAIMINDLIITRNLYINNYELFCKIFIEIYDDGGVRCRTNLLEQKCDYVTEIVIKNKTDLKKIHKCHTIIDKNPLDKSFKQFYNYDVNQIYLEIENFIVKNYKLNH